MKDFIEDFDKVYGKEIRELLIKTVPRHRTSAEVEKYKDAEKLAFALLEILDWKCFDMRFECVGRSQESKLLYRKGLTQKRIEAFLKRHAETVVRMHIEPPTYMGLLCGTFNFLNTPKPDKSIMY